MIESNKQKQGSHIDYFRLVRKAHPEELSFELNLNNKEQVAKMCKEHSKHSLQQTEGLRHKGN